MVESLETILKAESSPEYFILSFNETNDLLSLFCLRPYFYHKNTPIFAMAAFAQATFSAGLFLSYESLYYAINLINEAFTVSSFTETYNMVVSGLACPA